MTQPNILVFFTDQQRWDTAGCYGNPMGLTPNLDRLADEGVLFENVFSTQPLCQPVRSSIQSGKYATAGGVWKNGIRLEMEHDLLAQQFKQAGYETAYIGKLHLASTWTEPVPPELRYGYEDFWEVADGLEGTSEPYKGHLFDTDGNPIEFDGRYRVDFLTDRALAYLEQKRDKPFFLFFSPLEPHHQNSTLSFHGPDGSREKYADPWVPEDLKGRPGDWPAELPDYYGCCASLDTNLGRIEECLKRTGQWENTILIFTSDHGCHFRTRNSEYKRSCHESSIHVPMVWHGPGFEGGQRVKGLAGLIDLPVTLLEAAELDVPNSYQGVSLMPLIKGTADEVQEEIFIQLSEAEVGRALRTHKWKYGVFAPDKDGREVGDSDTYVERYLYDLEEDPHELYNLTGRGYDYRNIQTEYREVADELMARLKRRMVAAGEEEPEILPAKYYA
ncbi:sulfatase-like hydrolase/transferase [Planctomycetota bacterium]